MEKELLDEPVELVEPLVPVAAVLLAAAPVVAAVVLAVVAPVDAAAVAVLASEAGVRAAVELELDASLFCTKVVSA